MGSDIVSVYVVQCSCYLFPFLKSLVFHVLDMRKALSADKERRSVIPLTRPINVDELEFA